MILWNHCLLIKILWLFVLVSAGIELFFLPVGAVCSCWFSTRKLLITLVLFSCCCKSRTFSCFSNAGNEQTAKLANRNIPYHKCHAQFMNGVGQGTGSYQLFIFSGVWILACPGVRTFLRVRLFFQDFHEICGNLWRSVISLLRDWLWISRCVMRKIVSYIVCFAYSLLLFFYYYNY